MSGPTAVWLLVARVSVAYGTVQHTGQCSRCVLSGLPRPCKYQLLVMRFCTYQACTTQLEGGTEPVQALVPPHLAAVRTASMIALMRTPLFASQRTSVSRSLPFSRSAMSAWPPLTSMTLPGPASLGTPWLWSPTTCTCAGRSRGHVGQGRNARGR
jgi:hypothetical protein